MKDFHSLFESLQVRQSRWFSGEERSWRNIEGNGKEDTNDGEGPKKRNWIAKDGVGGASEEVERGWEEVGGNWKGAKFYDSKLLTFFFKKQFIQAKTWFFFCMFQIFARMKARIFIFIILNGNSSKKILFWIFFEICLLLA